MKNYENREKMYSPPKKYTNVERSPSRLYSNGPNKAPSVYRASNTSTKKTSQQNVEVAIPKEFKICS